MEQLLSIQFPHLQKNIRLNETNVGPHKSKIPHFLILFIKIYKKLFKWASHLLWWRVTMYQFGVRNFNSFKIINFKDLWISMNIWKRMSHTSKISEQVINYLGLQAPLYKDS